MSHFSVCVIVPDDGVVNNIHANNLEDHLIPVLAPFDEQTEEEKYREFEDRTEEAKADFENDTMRVVRFPDGSIHSIYDDAFNKSFFIEEDRIYAFGPNRDRKSKLQTEESKALELVTDYPVKSWYPSFEAYCDEHRGFVKASDGRWGYTCNPNAKWDWWQIGGRFPNRFLVPAGLQDCIPSAKDDDGESATHPEGYQYADAARKKDICWDVMRKIAVDTVEKRYQKCVRAFETKDLTDFGPLCRILDEGISAWGEMLYLKGETLDEYKARKGATDLDRYMCHTYAFVDRNGDWIGSGDMGWFGISSNDKDERAWNDEIQKLMNEAKDDDFLAIVDCHKQEEALKRQAEQEEQDRAFCEERNRKAEQMIDLAIRTIRGGGTLKNEPISLYKSRYDSSTYSIVNHLMRRYQVDVPLRTQGWINDKLISVTIENGKCEHLRYMRSKGAQCSQKIFDCMHELILKVCLETEG